MYRGGKTFEEERKLKRGFLRRYMLAVVVMGLIWVATAMPGFADLTIVETEDGERSVSLYKNNRLAMPLEDGMDSIFRCSTGELIVISHHGSSGRYWVGSYDVFIESFQGLTEDMGGLTGGFGDMGGMGDLFGALFGGQAEDMTQLQVRVSKAGEDTIAGYQAEHYVVETRTTGDWRKREEIWVSAGLLQEVASEAAACIEHFAAMEEALSGMGGFGLDEMFRVSESPEYRALHEKGFVVRRKASYPGIMGMSMDHSSELVEVSREPISEDFFTVPSGYQQVDTFFDL